MIEKTTEKKNLEEYLYSLEIRWKAGKYVEIVPVGKAFKSTIGNSGINFILDISECLVNKVKFRKCLFDFLYLINKLHKGKNGPICVDLESFLFPRVIREIESGVSQFDKKHNEYGTVFVLYLDPKSKYFDFMGITPEEWELGL